MKKYSPEELKDKAGEYFDSHPGVDVFYYTEDGNFFTSKKYAQAHASGNNLNVSQIGRKTLEARTAIKELASKAGDESTPEPKPAKASAKASPKKATPKGKEPEPAEADAAAGVAEATTEEVASDGAATQDTKTAK